MLKDAFALHQQGKFADAERAYAELLRREPGNFPALHLQGVLALQMGQSERGIGLIRQSLKLEPRQTLAHRDLGNALLQREQFEEALASYEQALALKPDQAEIFSNRGIALAGLQRTDQALASYGRAIALKPDFASAFNNRGKALNYLKRTDEALADFDKAIALQPGYGKALAGRGTALIDLNRPQEALESFDRALAGDPGMMDAHDGRGTALAMLGRPQEALASFDRAIVLEPGNATFHNNRGSILSSLDRLEEALESYDSALTLKPTLAQGHVNRGVLLADLKKYDAALQSFDRAVALDPASAEAHFGRATTLLITGRQQEGWAAYEWRKRRTGADTYHPQGQPQWTGREDIAGKTLFIEAEQGLGDMIQFCRYARLAADKGARVLLKTRTDQMRLLQSLDPRVTILAETPTSFDYHIPLMSLPLAFGGDFAACTPYLHAEAEKIAQWRDKIGGQGFKIGISWQGGPTSAARSFPLALLADIARRPGVRLISLQQGAGSEQLDTLPAGMTVETLGADYNSGPDAFIDAAAVMETMDLVIACDSALAHLAGALARPVWVALKYASDWRYLLGRDDSVWYPQMRLFRQTKRGDWSDVFAAMDAALGERMTR